MTDHAQLGLVTQEGQAGIPDSYPNFNVTTDTGSQLPPQTKIVNNTWSSSELVFTYLSVVLIGLIILIGTIGNILVFMAVKTSRKLQTISNVFIVNLSVVDVLFEVIVLPFHAYTNINQAAGLHPLLCRTVALVDYTLTGTTIMTIILIAYNRYRLVGDHNKYIQHFRRRNIVAMLGVAWILPMLCLLPPLLEIWGSFGYVELLSTCNLFEDSNFFKDLLLVLRTLTPCLLIVYFYICICCTSRARQSRLPSSTRNSVRSVQRERNERHMTKMVLTIILVFIISYFPCTITALIDIYVILPKPYHQSCRLCIYIGSAANPFIYGLLNSQFSQAYKKLVCFRQCYRGSDSRLKKVVQLATVTLKPGTQMSNVSNQFRKISNVETPIDRIDLLQTQC